MSAETKWFIDEREVSISEFVRFKSDALQLHGECFTQISRTEDGLVARNITPSRVFVGWDEHPAEVPQSPSGPA